MFSRTAHRTCVLLQEAHHVCCVCGDFSGIENQHPEDQQSWCPWHMFEVKPLHFSHCLGALRVGWPHYCSLYGNCSAERKVSVYSLPWGECMAWSSVFCPSLSLTLSELVIIYSLELPSLLVNYWCGKSLDDSSSNEQEIPFIPASHCSQMVSYVVPPRHFVVKSHDHPLAAEKWLHNTQAEAGWAQHSTATQDFIWNVFRKKKRNEDREKLCVGWVKGQLMGKASHETKTRGVKRVSYPKAFWSIFLYVGETWTSGPIGQYCNWKLRGLLIVCHEVDQAWHLLTAGHIFTHYWGFSLLSYGCCDSVAWE